jgi:dihydroorotase
MPLEAVIRATTEAPARAMRLGDRLGSLLPGRQADVTLLRLEEGTWDLPDVKGETRTVRRRLLPVQVFKRGQRFACGG